MSFDECQAEILECARYGEHEDLETILREVPGIDVNFKGVGGNTALHRAAANGEVACMEVLKKRGALHIANDSGNLPLHWAVQNAQLAALKYLIAEYDVDMLSTNDAGKSIVTFAFAANNEDILATVLSHDSATEERLLPEGGSLKMDDADGGEERASGAANGAQGGADSETDAKEGGAEHAVLHDMFFDDERDDKSTGDGTMDVDDKEDNKTPLRVRELPMTRADNPFGTATSPQDDTTGLAIWPASILLARWIYEKREMLQGKVVAELGAGCGLPALSAALYAHPAAVYVTDIHRPTLENAAFNVKLNVSSAEATELEAMAEPMDPVHDVYASTISRQMHNGPPVRVVVRDVNWGNPASFPPEPVDVILGSDLVYDENILNVFVPALDGMLAPGGSFFYIAPITGRAGMHKLEETLASRNFIAVEKFACPDRMYRSPLRDLDMCVLHFYDLTAKAEHTCYRFQKKEDIN